MERAVTGEEQDRPGTGGAGNRGRFWWGRRGGGAQSTSAGGVAPIEQVGHSGDIGWPRGIGCAAQVFS